MNTCTHRLSTQKQTAQHRKENEGSFISLDETQDPVMLLPGSLCFNSFLLFTSSIHLIHIAEAGEHPLCILIHLYEILGPPFTLSYTSYLGIQLPNGNPHLARQQSVEMPLDTWWDHPEEPRSESCRGSWDFSPGDLWLPDICWKIIMKRKTSWCVQLWQTE